MIAVPPFLLKRLYVKGSLCNIDDGFQFQLKNTLGSGYGTELLPLTVDGKEISKENSYGEVRYTELATLCGRRTLTLPDKLVRLLMTFSWILHLQSESPPSGLEFIKYPPIVSTEKLKREIGFQFRYSSKEAVMSFLSATDERRKQQGFRKLDSNGLL